MQSGETVIGNFSSLDIKELTALMDILGMHVENERDASDDETCEPARLCTECGQVHEYPTPKFTAGQKVRLVSADGFQHRDQVGAVVEVLDIAKFLVMPCDAVEYQTTLGSGFISERRLKALTEES